MRVLLVEDDRMIAQGLQTALRQDGYAVDGVSDGRSAAEALRTSRFDLGAARSGTAASATASRCCASCAGGAIATPVIIVTARDDVQNRIEGLDAGADDYIIKPFDLDEVGARMRSVLRRAAGRGDPCIRHRGISLDPVTHAVERDGVAGGVIGARVLGARGAAAASRRGAVARAARGPALWLERADRKQRGRGIHPRAAPQARERCDPHVAGRRLFRSQRR